MAYLFAHTVVLTPVSFHLMSLFHPVETMEFSAKKSISFHAGLSSSNRLPFPFCTEGIPSL